MGRQAPGDTKAALDAALEAGKESLRTGDAKAIKSALDGLNTAYSTAGAAMYQNQQASAEAGRARNRWGRTAVWGPPGRRGRG